MEHKGVLGSIEVNPGAENMALANPPRAPSMCGRIRGHFCREVANKKSPTHKC